MKWLLILFLFLASHFTYAETVSLEGVWQIQSTVYDGEEQSIRMPKQIKMFTGEMHTYYDPGLERQSAAFRRAWQYTLNNGTLSETIINHSNAALIGQTFSVTVELSEDGNTRAGRSRQIRVGGAVVRLSKGGAISSESPGRFGDLNRLRLISVSMSSPGMLALP